MAGEVLDSAAIAAAISAACSRRPQIAATGFADHARACLDDGGSIERLDELLIAWAAARGDRPGVAAFERVLTEAVAMIRTGDRAGLAQEARVRLLLGPAPRLAGYRGRGPLAGWLRVALTRIAIDQHRGRVDPGDATVDVMAELVDREPDPALRQLKARYRDEWKAALTAALAALPERARLVLRLHFVEGMRLAALGRLYDVHESTASRWVRDAASEVADRARADLTARLGVAGAELDSIARLVRSQLDLSIARVLGAEGPPG